MPNKIAVDIATNEALYSGPSLEFREGYLVGEGFRDRSRTPENTLLVDHDQPSPWIGRGWLYLDGGFDIAPWWRDAIEAPPPEPEINPMVQFDLEMNALTANFEADMANLQALFVAAQFADGVGESARVSALRAERAALVEQYDLDVTALIDQLMGVLQ